MKTKNLKRFGDFGNRHLFISSPLNSLLDIIFDDAQPCDIRCDAIAVYVYRRLCLDSDFSFSTTYSFLVKLYDKFSIKFCQNYYNINTPSMF